MAALLPISGYTYSIAGEHHLDYYRRDFPTERDATEFVRDLKGSAVPVHYNPQQTSSSALLEANIALLLQIRPPSLAGEAFARVDSVPHWARPLLRLFLWLSALGLALSFWAHLGALVGRRVAPEALFMLLHLGIFAVWLPAVLVARSTFGRVPRSQAWKVVFRGTPPWMRYAVYGFFGYAMINFLVFIAMAPAKGSGTNPPAVVWRGFSGHWMAFYSAAFAILYSALPRAAGRQCPNGHAVAANALYCEQCGQPVSGA